MSFEEASEQVLSHPSNAGMVDEMRRENNLPVEKAAASPLKRFGTLADGLVRSKIADNPRHAAAILRDSHAGLVDAARRESDRMQADENANWDDAEPVGKNGIRVNKSAAKADAMNRLTNLASGLMGSGLSPASAWARVRQANPEYAALAEANDELPVDLVDLTPDSSNYLPRTGQTQDMNRSGHAPNVGKRVSFQK